MEHDPSAGRAGGDAGGFVLVVMCGLPASGKSTLCRRMLEQCTGKGVEVDCLHFDELGPAAGWLSTEEGRAGRLIVADGLAGGATWKDWRAEVLKRAEAIIAQWQLASRTTTRGRGAHADGNGDEVAVGGTCGRRQRVAHAIVLDDNMHLRGMRKAVRRAAGELGVGFLQVALSCPLETALQRNKARVGDDRVDDDVVRRMAASFEWPDAAKFPWETNSLVLDTSGVVEGAAGVASAAADEVLRSIVRCAALPPMAPLNAEFERREREREAARVATRQSTAHQLDLALRRQTASWMQRRQAGATHGGALSSLEAALRQMPASALGRLLATEKKRLLQQLRDGHLDAVVLDGAGSEGGDVKDASCAQLLTLFDQQCSELISKHPSATQGESQAN